MGKRSRTEDGQTESMRFFQSCRLSVSGPITVHLGSSIPPKSAESASRINSAYFSVVLLFFSLLTQDHQLKSSPSLSFSFAITALAIPMRASRLTEI